MPVSPGTVPEHTHPAVIDGYMASIEDFSQRVLTAEPGSVYQWDKLAQLKRTVEYLWNHMTTEENQWKPPRPQASAT